MERRRSLFPWALRSHRTGMVAWGLGLAASIAATGPAYVATAKAAGQTVAQLGTAAQGLASSLAFLTGPLDRLDTVSGYVSYKIFPTATIMLAIYGALMGAQMLRGAEAKGWFDLWFAAGRTRAQITRDRIAAFLVTLVVITVCVYIGTVLDGVASQESMVSTGLGQCLAVALVAVFSFSLSFALSQFFVAPRTASALTSGYLVAAYFIANIYNSIGPLYFLHWLSPFYWYMQMRTLVPGKSFDILAMLVLVLGSAVTLGVGAILALTRDANAVSIPGIERTRPADHRFRPSRMWRRNLWMNWITEQPIAVVAWCFGVGAFTLVMASIVPAALKVYTQAGGNLRKLIETAGGATTPGAVLALLMTFAALLVAGFVVFQVARWASDATQQRNDAIFTQPVSMLRFVSARMTTIVLLTAAVAATSVAGTWIGALMGGYEVKVNGLARVLGDTVLFGFAVGGLGLLLVTIFRSGLATGVLGGLLILSYFLDVLKALFGWPEWVLHASVFNAFSAPGSNAPYLASPAWGDVLFLLLLGILGAGLSWEILRRGIRVTA